MAKTVIIEEGARTLKTHAKQISVYLPEGAKRKFRELAYKEERKEHQLYIEALREYLERRGFKSPSLWEL
jgi:hypothetical protein